MESTHNLLAQNYQLQFNHFASQLKVWKSEPTPENFHKLRLSVKNIRAIHQLIAPFMAASFMVVHLNRPFDKVFNRAGKIRKIYLNQQLAVHFEMNDEIAPKYISFLNKKMKQKNWFIRHTPIKKTIFKAHKVSEKVTQICNTLPANELSNRAGQFVSYKMTLVQQLMNESINDNNLHQVRKHIREIKTTINLGSGRIFSDEFCQLIDDLSKEIGEWHDRIAFIESVKQFMTRHRKSKIFMQPLLMKVKKELSVLSGHIIPSIDRLVLVYTNTVHKTDAGH